MIDPPKNKWIKLISIYLLKTKHREKYDIYIYLQINIIKTEYIYIYRARLVVADYEVESLHCAVVHGVMLLADEPRIGSDDIVKVSRVRRTSWSCRSCWEMSCSLPLLAS